MKTPRSTTSHVPLKSLLQLCWLFSVVALATSCSQDTASPGGLRRLTDTDVRIAIGKAGLRCEAGEMSPDAVYWAPERDWLVMRFPDHYQRFLVSITKGGFPAPQGDCDDHARAAALCAQLLQPGMAVGEYWFHTRQGTLHALNIALVIDGTGVKVVFWEPQTKRLVQLTEHETKNGCVAWRM